MLKDCRSKLYTVIPDPEKRNEAIYKILDEAIINSEDKNILQLRNKLDNMIKEYEDGNHN